MSRKIAWPEAAAPGPTGSSEDEIATWEVIERYRDRLRLQVINLPLFAGVTGGR